MSTRKRICSRRPMSGVAVMGFFACSVTLYGAPPSDRGLPDPTVRSTITMVDLDAGEAVEEIAVGPVLEILNHEAIERGVVATGGTAETPVYQQTDSCLRGWFLTGYDTFGFGAQGNQMIFDPNAFTPGDTITSYVTREMFCSSRSPNDCTFQVELWDGDTLAALDTVCNGGSPAPIPGTKATWTIPRDSRANVRAVLKEKVQINCDRVWMVMTPIEGCRVSWLLGGLAGGGCFDALPDIGSSDSILRYVACETFGSCNTPSGFLAGKCCDVTDNDAAFCDHTDADSANWIVCGEGADGTIDFDGSMCTDNGGATDFAAVVTGAGFGNCPATIFAPAELTITLAPKSVHAKPGDAAICDSDDATVAPPCNGAGGLPNIVGSEIKLSKGGGNIQMEVQISDWSGPDGTRLLKAFGSRLDSAGFTSALQGTIEEKLVECEAICDAGANAGLPCLGNPDCPDGTCKATDAGQETCLTTFGGICSVFGDPCLSNTFPNQDCQLPEPIEFCNAVSKCLDGEQRLAGHCAPAYIIGTRGDFALRDSSAICAVDLGSPNYSPSCVAGAGEPFTDFNVLNPPAKGAYAGTIWVSVPDDGVGTFTLNLDDGDTGLIGGDNFSILGIGLVPAKITIEVGQCCVAGEDPECVTDEVTKNGCDALGGVFNASKNCANECSPCPNGTDEECGDGDACTVDRCVDNRTRCSHTKVAIGADECCQENTTEGSSDDINGGGAIVSNDDGNECTDDTCDKGGDRGVPVHTNLSPDTVCDDGDVCTENDVCGEKDPTTGSPVCGGSDIEGTECNSDEDCLNKSTGEECPNMTCDVVGKVCRLGAPQLVLDVHLSGKDHFCTIGGNPCTSQDDCTLLDPATGVPENCAVIGGGDCFAQGEKVTVDVVFTGAPVLPGVTIVGGQFIVVYDPSCLGFVSIVPGGDPFVFELQKRVDQASGRIFYAVGVNPFGGVGALQGILATMSFTKLAGQHDCPNCILDFDSANPMNTYLADSNGKAVVLPSKPSKEIHVNDRLSLNVPSDDSVNSLCDERGAVVTWDSPTASSSCADPHGCDPAKKKCYDVNLVCSGSGPKGPYSQAVVMNGGLLDQGRSQFCCTATGKICGGSVNDCWTVDVNDQVSLDITVQLQPIMAATTLTRCIEFQLYTDCTNEPLCFRQDLVFGGSNFVGKYSDKKKIPKAQWACMTARDQSHSLESCTFLDCRADGNFEAVFAGDPFFGGNWLIQGNLDEWQKLQPPLFGSPDVIDILDFATYLIQYGQQVNPNTPCDPTLGCVDALAGPHADINGDGVVDGTDFAFVFDNFMVARKNCCCADATAGIVGRTEVSVRELREMGLDDLIVADLNRDGLVNMADMNEFLAGKRPDVKGTSRTRTGSGIGSRR